MINLDQRRKPNNINFRYLNDMFRSILHYLSAVIFIYCVVFIAPGWASKIYPFSHACEYLKGLSNLGPFEYLCIYEKQPFLFKCH